MTDTTAKDNEPPMTHVRCNSCEMQFYIPTSVHTMAWEQRPAGHFYCPSGHRLGWTKKTADTVKKFLGGNVVPLVKP